MHLIARFRRFCHCLWFMTKPGALSFALANGGPVCRNVAAWDTKNGLTLLACDCGKVFWESEDNEVTVQDIHEAFDDPPAAR